jgi:hypothetical protein
MQGFLLWGFCFEAFALGLLLWGLLLLALGFWAFSFLVWEAFGEEKNC